MSENKNLVLVDMVNGATDNRLLASKFSVSLGTIIRWRRELEQSKDNNKLHELIQADMPASRAIELIEAENDGEIIQDIVEGELENQNKVAELGSALQSDLYLTATTINRKLHTLISISGSVADLTIAASMLCELQTAFFDKKLTNINVQQNFSNDGGNSSYGTLLNDKPASHQ